MLNRLLLMCIAWLLAACQTLPKIDTLPPLPNPIVLHVQQVVTNGEAQNSLLIIEEQSPNQWRFIQTDALGAPLARQVLQHGTWRNDGFLPPNRQASTLFSAVYAYLAKSRHWDLPSALNTVEVQTDADEDMVKLKWQKHVWLIRELENE